MATNPRGGRILLIPQDTRLGLVGLQGNGVKRAFRKGGLRDFHGVGKSGIWFGLSQEYSAYFEDRILSFRVKH
jgi:hypothetical protein